jgi:hypothetical protein
MQIWFAIPDELQLKDRFLFEWKRACEIPTRRRQCRLQTKASPGSDTFAQYIGEE